MPLLKSHSIWFATEPAPPFPAIKIFFLFSIASMIIEVVLSINFKSNFLLYLLGF